MMRYDKYKPSGVEWIGEMPGHWKVDRLKWNVTFEYGESLAVGDRNDGPIPVFGSNGIAGFHDTAITKSPCIIIGRKGSFGKVNWSDVCCFPIDTTYFIDESKTWHDLRWLFYLLPNLGLDLFSRDTGVPGLNREDAYQNKVPVPPSEEQTAIANFLDERTAKIDTLIANKQKLIELLNEERTAIINQAVTRGIDPSVKLKPSGIDWLGDIPAHWEVKKLKYTLKRIKGALKPGPFGSDLKNSDVSPYGTFKVYTQRNIIENDFELGEDFVSDDKFISLRMFEIFVDDILVTTRGTIGKAAVFPKGLPKGILHPCLIRLQIDQSEILNQWLILYFNESSYFNENIKLNSNSTVIDVIYGYTLRDILILKPPIKEQKIILQNIEAEVKRIDTTSSKIEKEIELLQEYRTSLISEVVTGKIKVI